MPRRNRDFGIVPLRRERVRGGHPPAGRREHRVRFWEAIARGASSESAALEAGVLPSIGVRWFRKGGGMPPASPSRRCRGAICPSPSVRRSRSGSLVVVGCVRLRVSWVVPRRRSHGSCSETLPCGSGRPEYRASTAQTHADRRARRPKPAKLAVNPELRAYVQDRLSGSVQRPDGDDAGPEVGWRGRRHGPRKDRRWGKCWSPEGRVSGVL